MSDFTKDDLYPLELKNDVHKVKEVNKIGTLRIFLAQFHNTTQCSSATSEDFINAILSDENAIKDTAATNAVISKFSSKLDERGLGWHFFSTGDNSLRASEPNTVEIDFQIPEARRVDALRASLNRGIKVDSNVFKCTVKTLNDQQDFCKFSGGGDIIFNLNKTTAVIVTDVISDKVECSPPKNYQMQVGSVLEAKKTEPQSIEQLQYQLMANMIIGCTNEFYEKVSSKSCTKETVQLNSLSCYGIACTTGGTISFMKLEIDFTYNRMIFNFKIPFKTLASRISTAALLDYSITYIANKVPTGS